MTNYPLGDFLIRLKNAGLAKRHEISLENTKVVRKVSEVLKKAGFLDETKIDKDGVINVRLAFADKQPVLMGIKLVSKPGLRIYGKASQLANRKGHKIAIVSTPKGIMTAKDAVKANLGGEILVEIW
ncbi:MAG: 30S ribosomal protein S8 [Patescibacteria group bacterium]